MSTMAIIGMFDNCLCLSPAIYNCLLLLGDYLLCFDDPSRLRWSNPINNQDGIHAKRHITCRHEHDKSRKLFFQFFKSTKINRRENVPVAKNAKINSREKSWFTVACLTSIIEPPHGITNNLHRRKQRRRSASQ